MGAKFDQWLAKPSTIRFLRQLISTENCYIRPRCSQTGDLYHSRSFQQSQRFATLAISRDKDRTGTEDASEHTPKGTSRRAYKVRAGQVKDHSSSVMLGLSMSLSAGVPLIDKDSSMDQSFAELRYQSDVKSDRKMGKLLVDEIANVGNMRLWIEILLFRQRLDGLEGVVEVWHGMRMRNIDLPLSGEDAEILWTTFLHAAVPTSENGSGESHSLLTNVFDYAVRLKERTGSHFNGLHKCIVGRFLRSKSQNSARRAMTWSRCLFDAGFRSSEDITSIVEDAILSPQRQKALYSLSAIYLSAGYRDMYDACIREALKFDDDVAALFLHQMFIQKGDGPSTDMFSTPGVQRLFDLDKNESLPMKKSPRDRASRLKPRDAEVLKAELPRMTRASMNTIVGDVHGIKPKEISDHFCARLFATRAFSIDLVIRALSLFGVETLGPLALREMAIRAGSLVELSNKLNDLKAHGITPGANVYSQVVSKVVQEGQTSLWTVLLESDQHPEAYEDVATQEALLHSFLEQRQWAQAHICLLALSLAGAQSSVRAWNLLFQHYLQHHEYRPMLNTFQSIQSQGLALQQLSIRDIFWHVLPERQKSKRPFKGRGPKFFDPLDFVTNALIYGSENGASVHHLKWKEILKRYGMDHRWNDVERLVLWLADHYSPRKSASFLGLDMHMYSHRKRLNRRTMTLRNVFTSPMRQALFTWSFRSASTRNNLISLGAAQRDPNHRQGRDQEGECEEWARGLALQRRLNSRNQTTIPFPIGDVRKAFVMRMWILFGPAYSTLGLNNQARRDNQLSLAHFIRHANKVWNGLVDWVDPALLEEDQGNKTDLTLAFFGAVKQVSSRRREYVDVGAWMRRPTALKSNKIYENRITPGKQAAWEHSGLRLLLPTSTQSERLRIKDKGPSHRLQEHQSRAAREESLHPPPSQLYTPEQS